MPSIVISESLLDRIRALRAPGETSESETLARLLSAAEADREALLRAYEAADQDTSSTN